MNKKKKQNYIKKIKFSKLFSRYYIVFVSFCRLDRANSLIKFPASAETDESQHESPGLRWLAENHIYNALAHIFHESFMRWNWKNVPFTPSKNIPNELFFLLALDMNNLCHRLDIYCQNQTHPKKPIAVDGENFKCRWTPSRDQPFGLRGNWFFVSTLNGKQFFSFLVLLSSKPMTSSMGWKL